jgi:hypothetical protein
MLSFSRLSRLRHCRWLEINQTRSMEDLTSDGTSNRSERYKYPRNHNCDGEYLLEKFVSYVIGRET